MRFDITPDSRNDLHTCARIHLNLLVIFIVGYETYTCYKVTNFPMMLFPKSENLYFMTLLYDDSMLSNRTSYRWL